MNVFAVEIDGKVTLALNAHSIEDARAVCALAEMRADLCAVTAGGRSICSMSSEIVVRAATAPEQVTFHRSLSRSGDTTDMTIAFLVQVDGVVVTVIDAE